MKPSPRTFSALCIPFCLKWYNWAWVRVAGYEYSSSPPPALCEMTVTITYKYFHISSSPYPRLFVLCFCTIREHEYITLVSALTLINQIYWKLEDFGEWDSYRKCTRSSALRTRFGNDRYKWLIDRVKLDLILNREQYTTAYTTI